ncbi:ABC transporter family protein, partial [Sediminihabitans luteus]
MSGTNESSGTSAADGTRAAGTRPGAGTAAASSDAPMVRVRGLHKEFGSVHVLRGVDLDVAAGSVCVVLGPSGSGKSTLLRCVNELEEITGGSVEVAGELMGYRVRPDGR